MDNDKADNLFKKQFIDNGKTKKILKVNNPNVIIFILESYTAKIIEPLNGIKNVTPNFNNFCKEGILFSNFYASGDRTDKGLISILNGYPAQPTSSIIKFAGKTQSLPFLNMKFKDIDYHTQFVYGGDINFANFNSYFSNAMFDDIISFLVVLFIIGISHRTFEF